MQAYCNSEPENAMNKYIRRIVAGFLTLSVIGGVGGYLDLSLKRNSAKPATVVAVNSRTNRIQTVLFVRECHYPSSSSDATRL